MKILIVDDEPVSRKKMEKIMSTLGESSGFESGAEALTAFKEALDSGSPFDLVTLDVSMPEMDGTQVLHEIRGIEEEKGIPQGKRAKIIMVTCHMDKDTVITSVQEGCDDYVMKPFDKGIMTRKFQRLGLPVPPGPAEELPARRLVMKTMEKFKNGKLELPVLPKIIQEIQDAADEQSGSAEQLARIVERDAVISVKLISAANSPIYRAAEKIEDVVTAIRRLGLAPSKEMAIAIADKKLFNTQNRRLLGRMQKLWLHSLACAYCAKAVSAAAGPPADEEMATPPEKIFLMGLVHDIGCVLLLKSLENREFQNAAFDRGELLRTFQEVHTALGAALLEWWGFSKTFQEVAKCHEWSRFPEGTERELLIINLADHLASSIGLGFFDGEKAELPELHSARLLQIAAEPLEKIQKESKAMMEEALTMFQ